MIVLSLYRLGLASCAWHIFDRIAADGIQAGGEAYSNWLFITGATQDMHREVDVFEQMARTAHTRGLQAGCWNCTVLRAIKHDDIARAKIGLRVIDDERLVTPMSEHLRE